MKLFNFHLILSTLSILRHTSEHSIFPFCPFHFVVFCTCRILYTDNLPTLDLSELLRKILIQLGWLASTGLLNVKII